MSRLRTFIGIEPGKAIRDRIVALQDTLAQLGTEVKWVEPENLHVTMLFLGEVVDKEVPEVCRAVSVCAGRHRPFTMSIEKAGCFPHPRRPRVLWVGIGQGTRELCALHDDLEGPLFELGCYRREDRKYTPHITLGRVKSDRPTDKLASALSHNAGWKGGDIEVRDVHVMSSELTSTGPVYTILSRAKLGDVNSA